MKAAYLGVVAGTKQHSELILILKNRWRQYGYLQNNPCYRNRSMILAKAKKSYYYSFKIFPQF